MSLAGSTRSTNVAPRLDPDAKTMLELASSIGRPPLPEMSIEEARLATRSNQTLFDAPAPPARIDDFYLGNRASHLRVRRYRSSRAPDSDLLPALVYFHGGGWVTGDLNHGRWLCASLAESLPINIISVDYRLAPENPFPAAVEDAFEALDWIASEGAGIGIDTRALAVGGDSAGGNLAAASAIHARDTGLSLRCQILLYPVVDNALEHSSYRHNASGYGVTAEGMRWYRQHYLDGANPRDWRASPIYAECLEGVAFALVVSCGFDVLCDEAVAYVDRLRAAEVPVQHVHLAGQIHGFLTRSMIIGEANRTLAQIEDVLRDCLVEGSAKE